ncbi:MAG: T9SS type A sorting domain-containing protein [Bacteroidales bacterium]
MKTLITLLFLLASFLPGFSQSLTLTHYGTPIANGSTLDISGSVDSLLIVYLKVHNTGSAILDVKVRKDDISVVAGTMDTYCFAGQCYGGSTPVSLAGVQIAPGTYDTTFSGDYYPLGQTGVSIFRYTFFDVNNQNDTVSVTVRYSATLNVPSVDPVMAQLSNVYPNPANDKLFFDYNPSAVADPRTLVIRDMAGRKVRESELPNQQGTLEMDVTEMESGVYFYSLLQNNKVILTRKLVIKR